jgi:diguanylate cyclase (GGDEF)-like protein
MDVLAELVVSAYEEAEQDRQRTDRTISLMIEEVHQTHARLLEAFNIVPEGLVLLNSEGKYVCYNQRFVELYSSVRDTVAVGADFSDSIRAAVQHGHYLDAAGREEAWLAERLFRRGKDPTSTEQRIRGDRWLRIDERSTADGGSMGIHIDITDLKHREEALKQRSQQLVEAQNLGKIGDWSYRLGEADVWWSPQIFELLGFAPGSFNQTREAVISMYVGDGAQRILEAQADVVRTGGVRSVDVQIRKATGSVGDFVVTSKPMIDADNQIVGFLGTIQDISERKSAERALENLAYYDPLTGLANRALFQRKVNDVLSNCIATGTQSALLFLDLDRFKEVNDALGHDSGDELLAAVARLVTYRLGADHFIGRLGGDEFAIILMAATDRQAVERVAGELISTLSRPIGLKQGEVSIGASIGIAMIPFDGSNLLDIQRNADLALYRAKEDGRGRFKFFEANMSATIQKKLVLARDLRHAISANTGLAAWYQPQIDLINNRVSGFEALMRWNHPVHGNIPPGEFIPIAESSRLICDLGLWILREATHQAKMWIDSGETAREIAVNVSVAQIWHTDFVRDVATVLQEVKLPPHLLCLELTESLLIDHAEERVRALLTELKRIGVILALDDFGTKYSSLSYLTQLPFDKIKIDRSFMEGIANSERARKLLEGIIALGKGLGMTTVAEGAESFEEIEILKRFGCDIVQGFAFARPSVAAQALTFARSFESKAAGTNFDGRLAAVGHGPTQLCL